MRNNVWHWLGHLLSFNRIQISLLLQRNRHYALKHFCLTVRKYEKEYLEVSGVPTIYIMDFAGRFSEAKSLNPNNETHFNFWSDSSIWRKISKVGTPNEVQYVKSKSSIVVKIKKTTFRFSSQWNMQSLANEFIHPYGNIDTFIW